MQDEQKGVDIDLREISLSGYPEISFRPLPRLLGAPNPPQKIRPG